MERLTKKDFRTLLECIKECYPICDLETFTQRLVSRVAKIVPAEIFSKNGVIPPKRRHTCATYSARACSPSVNKILEQRVPDHRTFSRDGNARDTPSLNIIDLLTGREFQSPRVMQQLLTTVGMKYGIAPRIVKQVALNSKGKNFAEHDKIVLKLLSPHLIQAYRNAATVSHMQEKLTLVDRVLDSLHLGLIVVSADGKVGLATTCAIQQLRNYLGHRALRGNCLPGVLWKWVRQQEMVLRQKTDVPFPRSPLVLQREGRRLTIRLISDIGQSLLEEQPITTPPESVAARGLSPREAQVLNWLSQGKTNKEIGMILELSPRTVQKHLEHVYRKLGVETRTAAAARAYEIASMASKQPAN